MNVWKARSAQLRTARARLLELENGTRSEQIAAQRATVQELKAELKTIDIQVHGETFARRDYNFAVSADGGIGTQGRFASVEFA